MRHQAASDMPHVVKVGDHYINPAHVACIRPHYEGTTRIALIGGLEAVVTMSTDEVLVLLFPEKR